MRLNFAGNAHFLGAGFRATTLLLLTGGLLAGCGRQPDDMAASRADSPQQNSARSAQSGMGTASGQSESAAKSTVTSTQPNVEKSTSSTSGDTNSDQVVSPRDKQVSRQDDSNPAIGKPSGDQPDRVYRNDIPVVTHDDVELAARGIRRFAGRHLVIYTDIADEVAKELPQTGDALYTALVEYFGPLPPARDGREFQVTGYLMREQDRFRAAGVLPENLPGFLHGRHRGLQFWMNEQKQPYYRRHLMLHEMTHCFMTAARDSRSLPPVWYMEGMAELFGTHQRTEQGTWEFRVLPANPEPFVGWGRIAMIRKEVAADRFLTIDALHQLTGNAFLKNEPYAWSWAFCAFCDHHPRFAPAFRKLGAAVDHRDFARLWNSGLAKSTQDLQTEWALFAHQIVMGYDVAAAAVRDVPSGPTPVASDPPTAGVQRFRCELQANRGWQRTGVSLRKGETVRLLTTGRITLANKPKPWVSEAPGISFDYANGSKLGRVLAAVRVDRTQTSTDATGADSLDAADGLLTVRSVGAQGQFLCGDRGELFLRVNDHWSSLADNTGRYRVLIEVLQPTRR